MLRSSDQSDLLGADAICINQNDEQEPNEQVLLMRQIYQKADRVVVDLGDVSLEWYSVFDMMKELNMSRRLSNRTVSDGST